MQGPLTGHTINRSRSLRPAGWCAVAQLTGHSLPEAFIFEKDQKRSKKSFAANQPYGCLRHFESARASGPRKQPSMADSALYAIHCAPTHLHDHSQN